MFTSKALSHVTAATLIAACGVSLDAGFAAPVTRDFIAFTNPLVPQSDRLPASFVSNWPTWVLDTTNEDNPTWQKIPDSDGFVAPTSISELLLC